MARRLVIAAAVAAAAAATAAGENGKAGIWTRGPDHIPGAMPAAKPTTHGQSAVALDAGGRALQVPLGVEISGLFLPTSVTWDEMGHVIISEKPGVVKIMDGWRGQPNRILLDIQNEVASYGDHGLNHVQYYAGYIWAAYMKETAPWGDQCTDFGYIDRPIAEVMGCKVTGRVSRWPYDQATGTITGPEQVVIEGSDGDIMCGQFSTHGTTMVIPGPDGFMYISAGDGASFAAPDVGQMGNNPCNDPPEYRGAFRVQNPNKLNGKIIRLNPNTLEWEVFATGVRNPFRLSWYNDILLQSDTGWYTYEEINHIQRGKNYGWPCFEGPEPQREYKLFQHPTCAWLAEGNHQLPLFYYKHPENAHGDVMSISAIAGWNGRLFWGDYTTREIHSMNFDGSDDQLVMRDAYPVGLYGTPAGLAFINYALGGVYSVADAGAPIPSASNTPPALYLNVVPKQESWSAGGPALEFDPQTNIEGREGAAFTWTATVLFDCTTTSDCKSAVVGTSDQKHFVMNSPPVDGTLEVKVHAQTYKGTAIDSAALFPSVTSGAAPCTCTGARTVVDPGQLGLKPSATPSPSFVPGFTRVPPRLDQKSSAGVVQSQAFVGGVSAAAAVVVVGVVIGIAWYTGAFAAMGIGAHRGTDAPAGAGGAQAAAASAAGPASNKATSSIAARRTSFPGAPHVSTGATSAAGVGAGAPERTPAVAGNGQAAASTGVNTAAAGGTGGTERSPAARRKGTTPTGERRV